MSVRTFVAVSLGVALGATLAVSLDASPPAMARDDWAAVAEKIKDSVVYLESETTKCSGFVIDNARDLVLTAAHCDGKNLFADSVPVKVKAKDTKHDLLVLYVEDLDRPALALSASNPRIGDEVASYGYGWALERPLFRIAHVSDNYSAIPDLQGGPWLLVDGAFVPGQSGCPVVNAQGLVVSMVQMTTASVGLGPRVERLHEKVGKYFTQPK